MRWDESKDKELAEILDRFSSFIKANIHRYNLPKFGLEIDDILQDIKIKIWKILHHEKEITNYSSYIKKIVDSSVIDLSHRLTLASLIFIAFPTSRIESS
jgi:RNA polymerase sigma-70 factor (ECF subfamily)